tara:strand:+ start:55 stop:624 length:570 start_codon:yes stop_codon:yes gene_type:complete
MSTVSTIECNDCKGRGKTVDKPCSGCRGSGIMPVKKKIKLQIPPGADHGYRLRMRGQGGAGPNNGPKGDLYIVVNMKKHNVFQRQDNEIILDLEITPAQAVIGDSLRIPTLSGNVKLKIPSGTQSGDVLRLKGKGMPDISRPSLVGSQHVRINVKVPKPNGKTRKLWEELRELDSEKPSFLDRIMDKFG